VLLQKQKNIFIILAFNVNPTPLNFVIGVCWSKFSCSIGQCRVRSPIGRWSLQIIRQHILSHTNPALPEIGKTAASH
jgi:hypothetical protein